jgi:hypothetical protein
MKKAVVAVAHRLLRVAYVLIRDEGVYGERGGDYSDRRNPQRTARKLRTRLERIGFEVVLQRKPLSPMATSEIVPAEICSRCHRWRLGKCIHSEPKPKRTYNRRLTEESAT